MRFFPFCIIGGLALCILCGCTGHRRDTTPAPDGDTIEVTVKKPEIP